MPEMQPMWATSPWNERDQQVVSTTGNGLIISTVSWINIQKNKNKASPTYMWSGWKLEWSGYHREWRSCHHWGPWNALRPHWPYALTDLPSTGPTHQYSLQLNVINKPAILQTNANFTSPTWLGSKKQLGTGAVNAYTVHIFFIWQWSHIIQW